LIRCPFEATAYFHKKGVNQWDFQVKTAAYNHEPSESMSAHTTNRRLTPRLYEEMKGLGKAGLRPSEILRSLKKTHPNEIILATISTIYTARKKARQESLQGISPIVHLNKTLVNTNFTTATKVDQEGNLKALFFCHADSLKLLKAYHHIILLDCTYKTNKYRYLFSTFLESPVQTRPSVSPSVLWRRKLSRSTIGPCNLFSPSSKATRSPSLPWSSLIVSRL
jgi:hypothetical protein